MTSGWIWFRGPRNRVMVVQLPAETPTGSTWQLRSLGRTLPQRFLAVPVHAHVPVADASPEGEVPGDLPWQLTREHDHRILISPQREAFHELLPATGARLVASRLVRGGLALGLLLGILAWLVPSGIQAWRDRPDPLYEQVVDGVIVLTAKTPKRYRATWKREGDSWTRATPSPNPLARPSTRPTRPPSNSLQTDGRSKAPAPLNHADGKKQ